MKNLFSLNHQSGRHVSLKGVYQLALESDKLVADHAEYAFMREAQIPCKRSPDK